MAQQQPFPSLALAATRHGRRVMKLTRVRAYAQDKTSRTLHFLHPGGTGRGNSRVGFVSPEHVPAFEGEEGWFEMERIRAKPWSYWRAIRRVDPPPHA
ncbi:hypothetical protein [Caulobacter sp. UNC358MFTsu5.1]|uniref:hypothetical protein n=1 Tax=Caulobacter sp. UNC358MFTsu5.1 TaxID=1449049 RepID=UPI000551CA7F|nr:hypothetical protein [Caulobacter sp. UNC358MFTsu5.1]